MKNLLRCAYFVLVFVAGFVSITALTNWLFNDHRSLWIAALLGALVPMFMPVLSFSNRRGWIKGVIWNSDEYKKKQHDLALAREKIIADAKLRGCNEPSKTI